MTDHREAAAEVPVTRGTTIVAHFHLKPGSEAAFARWHAALDAALAGWPGFVRQTVMPPSPPLEGRWALMQWFEDDASAFAWLASPARDAILAQAEAITDGPHEVHVARVGEDRPAPVSMVVESRVPVAGEAAFRAWQQRIATAFSAAPGFRGYRLEPPVQGVRDNWVTIVRFDSAASLEGWIRSPERRALMAEGADLADERWIQTIRSAFEQWFPEVRGGAGPPQWKLSMIVLAVLFPTVFTLDEAVTGPLAQAGVPFWLTVFIGNALTVTVLAFAVPPVGRRLAWWLAPGHDRRRDARGTAVVIALYAAALALAAGWSGWMG